MKWINKISSGESNLRLSVVRGDLFKRRASERWVRKPSFSFHWINRELITFWRCWLSSPQLEKVFSCRKLIFFFRLGEFFFRSMSNSVCYSHERKKWKKENPILNKFLCRFSYFYVFAKLNINCRDCYHDLVAARRRKLFFFCKSNFIVFTHSTQQLDESFNWLQCWLREKIRRTMKYDTIVFTITVNNKLVPGNFRIEGDN